MAYEAQAGYGIALNPQARDGSHRGWFAIPSCTLALQSQIRLVSVIHSFAGRLIRFLH